MIELIDVSKNFTLHTQGGAVIPVMEGASLKVALSECVALTGAPGTGKSTLLRKIFGSYLADPGQVLVSKPLLVVERDKPVALGKAAIFLKHLNNPEHLCMFSPTTFSGGEPQRVNIARDFVHDNSVMLPDEPTASLNARNRESILLLIEDAKARGAAIVGIFRDEEARNRVSDREVDVSDFTPGLAA